MGLTNIIKALKPNKPNPDIPTNTDASTASSSSAPSRPRPHYAAISDYNSPNNPDPNHYITVPNQPNEAGSGRYYSSAETQPPQSNAETRSQARPGSLQFDVSGKQLSGSKYTPPNPNASEEQKRAKEIEDEERRRYMREYLRMSRDKNAAMMYGGGSLVQR